MDVTRNPNLGSALGEQQEEELEIDLTTAPVAVDLHDPLQRSRVEAHLMAIPDVLAARLVPGFDREVDELHVITTPDRNAKATVRDVQTVLLARSGVRIDHRVISVVQLDERQVLATTSRIQLDQVATVHAGRGVSVEVSLSFDDRQACGRSEGAATASSQTRSIARATLLAFSELMTSAVTLELRDAAITPLGGQELAVTVIEVRDHRGEEVRAGAALVQSTAADAVARSVLDALNRTVTQERR